MSTEHSEEDFRAIIKSFKDGLALYTNTLATSPLSELKTQEITDPDTELSKVAQLLSAHATKIGIAFRPPVSVNAAYGQIRETSEKMLLIIGATSQFADEKVWSKLFQQQVVDSVQGVIGSYITLLDELEALDFNEERKEAEEGPSQVNGRLVSVGKVWDSCKVLETLMQKGKLGVLKDKIKTSIAIVDDALEEFTEWIENPEVMDENDPFGLGGDNLSDEEDEEKEEKVIDAETLELAKKWTQKVKMLKLLLGSLGKSLPTSKDTSGADIDKFYREQGVLVEQIDDLVAAFFVNSGITVVNEQAKKLESQSDLLITLVRKLHKLGDEKKTQWLNLWQEKFLQ